MEVERTMKSPCGRTKSRSGKKFTTQSLAHHIQDCHDCRNKRVRYDDEPDFELTNMIADEDMPDGAYFALAHELGEL